VVIRPFNFLKAWFCSLFQTPPPPPHIRLSQPPGTHSLLIHPTHHSNSIMSKIGINGFGRIGRLVLRAAVEKGATVSNTFRTNFLLAVMER
jgi:hypothetical protein